MYVIGLTGSIACGKTTISNYLLQCGFPVIDGDQLSRELTKPGSPVLDEIRKKFGDRFINTNGNLNRRALGQLVFRDSAARLMLDGIMEPHLLRMTQDCLRQLENEGADICFLDMPLLFEKNYDRFCNSVWTVWLPERLQLSRLMTRDGFSEEDALNRIRSVMSSDEKASRSRYVIDNSGSVAETLSRVDRLLEAELHGSPPVPESAAPASKGPASPVPADPLPVIDRPESARRRPSDRKVSWRMPAFLRVALIVLCGAVLFSVTALALSSARLRDLREQHDREQKAIDYNYPLPDKYVDWIERYADEYNLRPSFIAAVIMSESSFRETALSAVGARGLMQLMPDTAKWIAGKLRVSSYSFESMDDPEINIRFGCWYLNYLCGLFDGDPVCVACAYHAGQGQVTAWLSDSSISPDGRTIVPDRLPPGKTRDYAKKIMEYYGIYEKKYFSTGSISDASDAYVLSEGAGG